MRRKERAREKELPTATNMNPAFTVQSDAFQPLDLLITQADNGLEQERSDIHTDNEDM